MGELQGKDGKVSTTAALDGKAHVLVYFSAHWCPPCRGFTPVLSAAYNAKTMNAEVVFVSSDRDEAGFNEYYGEMPWLALPFDARDAKQKLASKYGVSGIPMLVVLNSNGELVTGEGRAKYAELLGAS